MRVQLWAMATCGAPLRLPPPAVGAGNSEGGLDASNILKPALARGELQCIGATTLDEYREHIEADPAFARRFQVGHVLKAAGWTAASGPADGDGVEGPASVGWLRAGGVLRCREQQLEGQEHPALGYL